MCSTTVSSTVILSPACWVRRVSPDVGPWKLLDAHLGRYSLEVIEIERICVIETVDVQRPAVMDFSA
ncbi:hypothetical protein CH293_15030 [Rhodococcus sp. 14-2470-1b]|nr:hypothetical protein CH293_15030 [Rhodococcus sp. 14-2470-1b]